MGRGISRSRATIISVPLGLLALVISLAHVCGSVSVPPTFATNYRVSGVLSLPYAELVEPFEAYYDKQSDRSRVDYYRGVYKVYQIGSKSPRSVGEHGAVYKSLYVPASFHPEGQQRAYSSPGDQRGKTKVKRVCFSAPGSIGYDIQASNVLPDLSNFRFDGLIDCPGHMDHDKAKCEVWLYRTHVGDKDNTYRFFLRRDKQTNAAIPVLYRMLGYDTLLGSHYDRYDIFYFNFKPNGAADQDFDVDSSKCGPMPGPGLSGNSTDDRAQMIAHNPIHELVIEPHRYDHVDAHFAKFMAEYNKNYESEFHKRSGWFNFLHNLRFIRGKNRELKQYKLKTNQYADRNVRELSYLRGKLKSTGGYNGGLDYVQHKMASSSDMSQSGDKLPETWDWTVLGAVTQVKDQAVCGSCWSFGTVGAVEGSFFLKTGRLVRFSQQQLVDCSWQYGNNGCDGGEDFRAYQYIKAAGGLAAEEDYGHYLGIDGRCHDKDVRLQASVAAFYNVTGKKAEVLQHAIYHLGPVSISIDASQPTFTFYSHGAYYDPKCQNSPDNLDHSVLAVGWTHIDGQLVWKVKNSWSTYWGDDGYVYISAKDNNCGVLDAPTVPIVDEIKS